MTIESIIKKYEEDFRNKYGHGNVIVKRYHNNKFINIKNNNDLMGKIFMVDFGRTNLISFEFNMKFGQWNANIEDLNLYDNKVTSIKIDIFNSLVLAICQNLKVQFVTIDTNSFNKHLIDNGWEISYIASHNNGEKMYHYVRHTNFVFLQMKPLITQVDFTTDQI